METDRVICGHQLRRMYHKLKDRLKQLVQRRKQIWEICLYLDNTALSTLSQCIEECTTVLRRRRFFEFKWRVELVPEPNQNVSKNELVQNCLRFLRK